MVKLATAHLAAVARLTTPFTSLHAEPSPAQARRSQECEYTPRDPQSHTGSKKTTGERSSRGLLLWPAVKDHPDLCRADSRKLVPLLPNVDYYFAAATVGRDKHDPLGQLLGDLLVRPGSAVGSHSDDLRKLDIKPENCAVFHERNHFDLLDDERVHRQIIEWFEPVGGELLISQ